MRRRAVLSGVACCYDILTSLHYSLCVRVIFDIWRLRCFSFSDRDVCWYFEGWTLRFETVPSAVFRNVKRTVTGTDEKRKATANQSALKESSEMALSGEQRASAQKETPAVSATMEVNVETLHALPLPLWSRRRTKMGKFLLSGLPQRN